MKTIVRPVTKLKTGKGRLEAPNPVSPNARPELVRYSYQTRINSLLLYLLSGKSCKITYGYKTARAQIPSDAP